MRRIQPHISLYSRLKYQLNVLVPIGIAGVILIGLIVFDIIYSDNLNLSKNSKRVVMWSELALSIVVSLFIIVFFFAIFSNFRGRFGSLHIWMIVLLFTSPFMLSVIRSWINNRSYNVGLAILTILSTVYSVMITIGFAIGPR